MLVYREQVVRATVSIPDYLRAHAKEQGISLSGTLREALKRDYEEKAGAKGYQPTPAPRERPTNRVVQPDDDQHRV